MGAYVSKPTCEAKYNITLECAWNRSENGEWVASNLIQYGEFQPDPDIAGTGNVRVFFAVTAFTLLTPYMKMTGLPSLPHFNNQTLHDVGSKLLKCDAVADMLENLILSCSDQQVFTGGAYALTLRYFKGCSVSAYHYNIVANMMMLTCATHLMSMAMVSRYWQYPFLALLRVLLVTGLVLVTGLLLSNQNAMNEPRFPTEVPPRNESVSLLVEPAACFQSENSPLDRTIGQTEAETFITSKPDNKIPGWNFFLIILIFYAAALIAEAIRFFWRRRISHPEKYANKEFHRLFCFQVPRITSRHPNACRWASRAFWVYQVAGVGIGMAAIIVSWQYISDLRGWINHSGYISALEENNPENDATSFGQLVPIFLTALTLFTFVQTINEKWIEIMDHNNKTKMQNGSPAATNGDSSQQQSDDPDKKNGLLISETSVPPTPAPTGHSSFPPPGYSGLGSNPATPPGADPITPAQSRPAQSPRPHHSPHHSTDSQHSTHSQQSTSAQAPTGQHPLQQPRPSPYQPGGATSPRGASRMVEGRF
ncbi:hypothetical protein BDY21DRAFT_388794 [Lineolata rhizophorae]|uniref:Uncharacterized protein n=1 Tax=Lineolata rhizophorae TaxID=578093 RepID=A0A6A6PCT0_9PEZI|nr:hypothetical protein BDY21DRAFT_388794 [Lineolata rhizophorae]